MRGIIVDAETTGLGKEDEIVELGVVEFTYNRDTREPKILRTYSGLEKASRPVCLEALAVNKLDEELLDGMRFQDDLVLDLFKGAEVVIAHNAAFDRRMIEARWPDAFSPDVVWCCSVNDLDWKTKGFKSRKLDYLAADHGFINPFAHRAIADCLTTFRLVTPYLEELIGNSHVKKFKIDVKLPKERRIPLKNRNYSWAPDSLTWWKTVAETDLDLEKDWLESQRLPLAIDEISIEPLN